MALQTPPDLSRRWVLPVGFTVLGVVTAFRVLGSSSTAPKWLNVIEMTAWIVLSIILWRQALKPSTPNNRAD